MYLGAEELVTPGGPSAPAWAFFSAISLALIALIGQQLKARSDLKALTAKTEAVKDEASKAYESAAKTQENTKNVSNGFVGRMDRKLDHLTEVLTELESAHRDHLQWHLEQERKQ